jgi:hypothetical protein
MTRPQDLTMRTHWKRIGDDRYEALDGRKSGDGKWEVEWKLLHVRLDAPKHGQSKAGT